MAVPFLSDLTYGARSLTRHRGATIVAVLSMAVAIGPNAALFSIMDRVFLPGGLARAPETVLGVRMRTPTGYDALSLDEYRDLAEQTAVFSDVVAAYRMSGVLALGDTRELVAASLVSTNYLGVLRIRGQSGRLFAAADDGWTDSVPVVISDDLWRRRLAAAPAAVGTSMVLNERTVTIVGILEPGFRGLNVLSPTDVWAPLGAWLTADGATRRLLEPRDRRALEVMGLLRPGVTTPQARDDLANLAARLTREYPETMADRTFVTWSARDDDRRKRVGVTAVALSLAGLVLLVACTNVATMLLARGEARRRETAVRLALGASRWQLFRLLLAEALLMSAAAALLGLLFAHWLLGLTHALRPVTLLPIVFDFGVDGRVVGYTMLLAFATTAVCALAPMRQAGGRDLVGALRSDAAGYVRRRGFTRSRFGMLVVAQIAISQILLCGGALLLRSYQHTVTVRPGFDPGRNVLMVTLVTRAGQSGAPAHGARYFALAERASALPGVRAASFIDNPPLSGFGDTMIRLDRDTAAGPVPMRVPASSVGLGYFGVVGTRLLHGRDFERRDIGTARSIVVNEALVRRVFPSLPGTSDAVGRALGTATGSLEIIGVVEDGTYGSLRESPQPRAFLLAPDVSFASTTLLVETAGPPETLTGPVRDAVRALEPDIWIAGVTSLTDHTRVARVLDEFGAMVAGAMGLLSLLLAAVGLYGLTGFWVQRRMRECGIRIALGATSGDVVSLLQRQAMRPVLAGMVLGLAGGLLLGPVMASLLFGVSPYDPAALGSALIFTFLMGLVATRIPARRCAAIEPGAVLKQD
jgi:putative ABC transport system permease protein